MKPEIGPPESCRGLWYNPKVNRFKDESGIVRHDLSLYFPAWKLDIWKRSKEYAVLQDRNGESWELFYDTPYCEDECRHRCNICRSKCEIWGLLKDNYYHIIREELLWVKKK